MKVIFIKMAIKLLNQTL